MGSRPASGAGLAGRGTARAASLCVRGVPNAPVACAPAGAGMPVAGILNYTLPAVAPGGKSFVRLFVTPTP